MQKIIFRPKYAIRWSWDVLSIGLSGLIVLLFSFWKFGITLSNVSLSMFLIFFIVYFSPFYIRRIVFASSFFTVENYVWPSKKIEYSDIIDIGPWKVKTRKGNVSFLSMRNAGQLHSLFIELIKQGKIHKNQLEKKIEVEETIDKKSVLPALIISLPFCILLFYFWPFHRYWFSSVGFGASSALIFFIVGSIVKWIMKKRLKNDKAG
jgi:hypothetical protein